MAPRPFVVSSANGIGVFRLAWHGRAGCRSDTLRAGMADTVLQRRSRSSLGVPWRAVEGVALLGALALGLWLRVSNLDAYTGSFDEGIRSQQLLLMAAGYRPFQDIFASQGPLLLDLLYPFYLAFGQTLTAARAGVVVCSLVALIGAWWTARLAAGPVAGVAAVVILALSPSFLEGSRLALAEVPTIAPSLLALGALLAYRGSRDRRLLVLSAVCCALAVLIKPMALHIGAPLAVLLLLPSAGPSREALRSCWRRLLADVRALRAGRGRALRRRGRAARTGPGLGQPRRVSWGRRARARRRRRREPPPDRQRDARRAGRAVRAGRGRPGAGALAAAGRHAGARRPGRWPCSSCSPATATSRTSTSST